MREKDIQFIEEVSRKLEKPVSRWAKLSQTLHDRDFQRRALTHVLILGGAALVHLYG